MTLGVWSIEDEVSRDSSARFIEVFVESLDLEEMGFEHAVPAPTGRPPYSPSDLVKLFIYGDQKRIRSSRRLHRECGRNVELFFLLNRLCPDFRTIADFRKKHHKQLRQILLIFARACRELNILDGESLCLDGTTIRASNGKKRSTSIELSRKKLEYARAQLAAVERYLDTLDGGREAPPDRRFPRHGQPERPGADLRERRDVPEGSGAGRGGRDRGQGLRERGGHREVSDERRRGGRGLHTGPRGARVFAGVPRKGDHAADESLDETRGHSGVPLDCYAGTNVRVQLQELGRLSCFIRHADSRVTCPKGNIARGNICRSATDFQFRRT